MKVSENKPHSIHLRLTDEQYQYCSLNAELMGVSVSEFLRMVVNSLVVVSKKAESIKLGDLNANHQDNIEHSV